MSDDGFGGRELSLEDPLGETSDRRAELELDRGDALPSRPAADPQELMFGDSAGRMLGDAFEGLGPEVELELDLAAVHGGPVGPPDLPLPPSMPPGPGPVTGAAAASAPVSRAPLAAPLPAPRSGPPSARARVASGSREPVRDHEPAPIPPRAITLADFGPAPTSILLTVPYALHVVMRRRALKAELARLKRLRDAAARDRSETLIELGRALHARRDHEALATLSGHVKRANEAGEVAGEHTAELGRVRQAASTQREAIAAQVAAAEERLAPLRAREAELAAALDARKTAFSRADARLARTKIELRNLAQLPTPDEVQRQALEAEREARAAEADRARAEVEALQPDLTALRREIAGHTKTIADMESEAREVDRSRERAAAALTGGAQAAEDAYHAAVSELAEEALKRGVAAALLPELAKSALHRAQAVDARDRETELHEIALGLADRPSVQRGLAILGVVAFLALGTLLFAILR